VNYKDINNTLKNIKRKNDCDGIKAQYLIDAMEVVGDTFCNIINMSLMKGFFLLMTHCFMLLREM
jgi:hypothetical protein